MYYDNDWALVIPLANEEEEFEMFMEALTSVLDRLNSGKVYLIVDKASKDMTLELSRAQEERDPRFRAVWAPENKNVVDAYLRGYREAYENGHELIIEMDAGLSHDPRALPMFIRVLNEGNECAFGSRFINGGSITESSFKRLVLSKVGTVLSNLLLGTSMHDMTSGYQGFHRNIVGKFLAYELLSKAHFYQTELRYLLRSTRFAEIPIHYKAPSPRVSEKAIRNSIDVLLHYFLRRITFRSVRI
ncbi:MAG: glycosyltransferase [Flavobacteriales bacterium]